MYERKLLTFDAFWRDEKTEKKKKTTDQTVSINTATTRAPRDGYVTSVYRTAGGRER